MKQPRRIASFFLIILLSSFLSPSAFADDSLLDNTDFSSADIPEGWDISAYTQENYSVYTENGALVIESSAENDVRLCCMVEVQPDTVYRLSAEISAEGVHGGRGACVSVDNYILDGTYAGSDGKTGSFDWTKEELLVRTGENQTYLNVALRLGYYSELSSGTARFRSVTLTETKNVLDAASAVSLQGTVQETTDTTQDESDEAKTIRLKSYLHLFVVCAVVLAGVLIWGFYRNRARFYSITIEKKFEYRYFGVAVLAGLLLRLVLSRLCGGHDYDMSCWIAWGRDIVENGTAQFYTAAGHEWYDYPPGYMLVLAFITRVLDFLGISAYSGLGVFAFTFPAYVADAGTAALLIHFARKNGFSESACLFLGTLTVFNPAAVILSGAWGQIDSILTFFLLLSFSELTNGRRISAGIIYGIAIMTKWQALIYGPVLAAAYLLTVRSYKDAAHTALGVLGAVCVIFALSLPFRGSQSFFWIVEKFFRSAGEYDYASVEAYNFLALCGGNWASASGQLVFGISYKTFGTAAIICAVLLSIAMLIAAQRKSQTSLLQSDPETLYISAAFCMFMIFTFGHYMHERYVFPVMILLLTAYIYSKEKRFLACSMLLSVVLALNEATAMYVVSNAASSAVRGTAQHQSVIAICSIFEVLTFMYTAYVCMRRSFISINEEAEANA